MFFLFFVFFFSLTILPHEAIHIMRVLWNLHVSTIFINLCTHCNYICMYISRYLHMNIIIIINSSINIFICSVRAKTKLLLIISGFDVYNICIMILSRYRETNFGIATTTAVRTGMVHFSHSTLSAACAFCEVSSFPKWCLLIIHVISIRECIFSGILCQSSNVAR